MFDALISGHVSMTLDRFSFALSKENKFQLLTMQGQKKKSGDSEAMIDSAVAPLPLSSLPVQFISCLLLLAPGPVFPLTSQRLVIKIEIFTT